MKLSIALATYNGERYLRPQLDSFASQDRLPDELVAYDDQSSDGTAEVLAEFAARAPFPVVVRRNERRLGLMGNFEEAASRCTGDVVFFSDQDDVWLPGKLARHEAIYRDEPEVGMIFSNATIVDETLNPVGQTLYEYTATTPARVEKIESKHAFELLVHRTFAYGCTMSFRSGLLGLLRPFPLEFLHDRWVQIVLAAATRLRALPEPYLLYRRHTGQTLGIHQKPPEDPAKMRMEEIHRHLKAMEYLLGHLNKLGADWRGRDVRGHVRARIAHLRRRAAIGKNPALGALTIARELASGGYLRHGEHSLSELKSDFRTLKAGRPPAG